MASIVVNTFEFKRGEVVNEKTFVYHTEISRWADETIRIATSPSHNIITGYLDGTFKPKNNATRAEAVTVIVRTLEK